MDGLIATWIATLFLTGSPVLSLPPASPESAAIRAADVPAECLPDPVLTIADGGKLRPLPTQPPQKQKRNYPEGSCCDTTGSCPTCQPSCSCFCQMDQHECQCNCGQLPEGQQAMCLNDCMWEEYFCTMCGCYFRTLCRLLP
jgi:hypothetical protein